jgi:predicted alpha/beta-hydrolase family hydrolase
VKEPTAVDFLTIGPDDAVITVLLAHGAGAPMDSAAMTATAEALAAEGLRVVRFEFDYMAARRSGTRRPPPKAELLIPQYERAVSSLPASGTLIIGGKSMGGRVASMAIDSLHAAGKVSGLLCLGYPFHPPDKPQQLRTAHLKDPKTPTLIVQGTRDPFGTLDEVPAYDLSSSIDILWLEDGDHDLKPRKSISGFTAAEHLRTMARRTREWAQSL